MGPTMSSSGTNRVESGGSGKRDRLKRPQLWRKSSDSMMSLPAVKLKALPSQPVRINIQSHLQVTTTISTLKLTRIIMEVRISIPWMVSGKLLLISSRIKKMLLWIKTIAAQTNTEL